MVSAPQAMRRAVVRSSRRAGSGRCEPRPITVRGEWDAASRCRRPTASCAVWRHVMRARSRHDPAPSLGCGGGARSCRRRLASEPFRRRGRVPAGRVRARMIRDALDRALGVIASTARLACCPKSGSTRRRPMRSVTASSSRRRCDDEAGRRDRRRSADGERASLRARCARRASAERWSRARAAQRGVPRRCAKGGMSAVAVGVFDGCTEASRCSMAVRYAAASVAWR